MTYNYQDNNRDRCLQSSASDLRFVPRARDRFSHSREEHKHCVALELSLLPASMSLRKVKGKSAHAITSSKKSITPKGSTSASTASAVLQQISHLEKKITASTVKNADLNPLVDLLELANKATKLKIRIAALNALHNAFSILIQQGKVIGKVRQQTGDQAEDAQAAALLAVREWTKGRWHEYQELLCALLCSREPSLAVRQRSIDPSVNGKC